MLNKGEDMDDEELSSLKDMSSKELLATIAKGINAMTRTLKVQDGKMNQLLKGVLAMQDSRNLSSLGSSRSIAQSPCAREAQSIERTHLTGSSEDPEENAVEAAISPGAKREIQNALNTKKSALRVSYLQNSNMCIQYYLEMLGKCRV